MTEQPPHPPHQSFLCNLALDTHYLIACVVSTPKLCIAEPDWLGQIHYALTEKLFPIVEAMQKHFSAGSGTYYSDAIFFLSVAMHRIMPAGELWDLMCRVVNRHKKSN
uniref:Uncharacterized protein n=1 Tax=Cyprinus carpio TaxID=7962 RepID=A0A8C1LP88_CYPCA